VSAAFTVVQLASVFTASWGCSLDALRTRTTAHDGVFHSAVFFRFYVSLWLTRDLNVDLAALDDLLTRGGCCTPAATEVQHQSHD